MMPPRAIAHRGSWHDNRALGVLHAFLHPPYWAEVDVLWTGHDWVLAHDSRVYQTYTETRVDRLSELMDYVRDVRAPATSPPRYMLLDVKWEEMYNRTHVRSDAISRLADVTATMESSTCLWYQFSDRELYRMGTRNPWLQIARLGFLVESALSMPDTEMLSADFLMLPLDRYSPLALKRLYETKPSVVLLLGYTCPSISVWTTYSRLYSGCLDGLVVDMNRHKSQDRSPRPT